MHEKHFGNLVNLLIIDDFIVIQPIVKLCQKAVYSANMLISSVILI